MLALFTDFFQMLDIFNTIFKYKEKESPDKLGLYPESVHVDAMPERRYLWTSRILVVVACMSISFNMMLASTIYLMLPQRSSYPRLLYINDYFSKLDQIEPQERRISATDLITEQHIYNYIMLRHVIPQDFDELRDKWAPYDTLYWYSTRGVYDDFAKREAQYSMDQFRNLSLRRDVKIQWIEVMSAGVWQAQFLTYDYVRNNPEPIVNIWRAVIRIGYGQPAFRNRNDLAKNPFGFIVSNYSLGYMGTPETSAHYLETAKELRDR